MDILQQLKNIYSALNRMTINGDSNVENMYAIYYTLSQLIQQLEAQAQAQAVDAGENV